jgi:hypothetical protein
MVVSQMLALGAAAEILSLKELTLIGAACLLSTWMVYFTHFSRL